MVEQISNMTEHNIIMENRKKLILTGVSEVAVFEDENAELKTSKGNLTIRGNMLKMESYNSETGDLTLNGSIYAIVYTNDDAVNKGGFLKRIFK